MDIKLKRYNIWLKVTAFVLVVAFSCGVTVMVAQLVPAFDYYRESASDIKEYFREDAELIQNSISLICRYKSEDEIRTGVFVTKSDIESEKWDRYYEDDGNMSESFEEEMEERFEEEYEKIWNMLGGYWNEDDERAGGVTRKMCRDYFDKKINNEIKNDIIRWQLRSYGEAIDTIKEQYEIVYYIDTGSSTLTNSDLTFDEINKWKYRFEDNPNSFLAQNSGCYSGRINETDKKNDAKWVFAFTDEYMVEMKDRIMDAENENAGAFSQAGTFMIYCTILSILCLLCISYLIFAAGRKEAAAHEITLLYMDKMYNELTTGAMILAFICIGSMMSSLSYSGEGSSALISKYITIAGLAGVFSIFYGLFLMLVRHVKSRTLFTQTIIYTGFKMLKYLLTKVNPMRKTVLIVIVLG